MPKSSKEFNAIVVWMNEDEFEPGREYYIKHGSKMTKGHAMKIHHRVDVNTMDKIDATQLGLNEIGIVDFEVDEVLHFDSYSENRSTGAFIIIDRISNLTVGAGMISHALDDKDARSYSEFEMEFNALVRKHFPHWGSRDITKLL